MTMINQMNVTIQSGCMEHLPDCVVALENSELGRRYFAGEGSAERAVTAGLEQGDVSIALLDGHCAGFIWILPKGVFRSFPYIHIIAVKEDYRNKGIGRKLMAHAERAAFADAAKIFLLVADFNPDAKRLYERIGFRQVGEIPNLYRDGITEYLMMKER